MTASTSKLSQSLFDRFYTTKDLKAVSDTLESLCQNQNFKTHAQSIVNDHDLTDGQKTTQLLYLLRAVNHPILYDFFSDIIDKNNLWLFSSDKIDYFDRFVQEFQTLADTVKIVYLTFAASLNESECGQLAKYLKDGLGYPVLLSIEVNPAILGGVQVKLENYLFDLSLRTKFHQFQTEWLKTLDETQSQVTPLSLA